MASRIRCSRGTRAAPATWLRRVQLDLVGLLPDQVPDLAQLEVPAAVMSWLDAPGGLILVTGATGSGKSTVLNLVARFTDATSGQVLLDGVDVRQQPIESVWAQIGLVPQRTYLFGGTVGQTVRFGAPDATDADVWQALEVAQRRDFVEALPDYFKPVDA